MKKWSLKKRAVIYRYAKKAHKKTAGALSDQQQMMKILDEFKHNVEWLDQRFEEKDQIILHLLREQQRRKPTLLFPFSLLSRAIENGFTLLERAVGRLLRAVIR